ncbi:unnamed protein product, partial [Protopolystoma xenopodis]
MSTPYEMSNLFPQNFTSSISAQSVPSSTLGVPRHVFAGDVWLPGQPRDSLAVGSMEADPAESAAFAVFSNATFATHGSLNSNYHGYGMATPTTQSSMLTTSWDDAKKNTAVIAFIFSLYAIVFFLGLPGNILVVHVVLRTKAMQTITNLFITNLAISDILMTLVATPFTPFALYVDSWTLPDALCKLLPTTMGVSVYVSTLTSTAIAVDRYFVIVHPFVLRMKKWLCLIIIITVWTIAILISMPLAVYQQKNFDPIKNITSCQERWPREAAREVFTIVSFVLQFVVPCSIISVCYLKVSQILRMRCIVKIGSGVKSRYQGEQEIRRKRRTNTMLIAMVIIFVVCWIPLNVHWIVTDVINDGQINGVRRNKYFTLIFFVCHLLAMSSAVYNPFLYAWMNENFRKEFRRILPCLFRHLRPASHTSVQLAGTLMTTEWSTAERSGILVRKQSGVPNVCGNATISSPNREHRPSIRLRTSDIRLSVSEAKPSLDDSKVAAIRDPASNSGSCSNSLSLAVLCRKAGQAEEAKRRQHEALKRQEEL